MPDADKKGKSIIEIIRDVAIALGAVITVAIGINTVQQAWKQPEITVQNHLALPIVVVINDSTVYTDRIEPGGSKTIRLLSEDDFPAMVSWKVVRNRNGNGAFIGEALTGTYARVDKGQKLEVKNKQGANTYFFPIIKNNTGEKCTIIINDKLSTNDTIGISNSGYTTNLTGYFKYASNSNITLKCPSQTLWHGERNDIKSQKPLHLEQNSGITNVSFP